MSPVWSKRAIDLVALARNNRENEVHIGTIGSSSPMESVCSSVSNWWDDIYEAKDITKLKENSTLKDLRRAPVTRKLFISPAKQDIDSNIPSKLPPDLQDDMVSFLPCKKTTISAAMPGVFRRSSNSYSEGLHTRVAADNARIICDKAESTAVLQKNILTLCDSLLITNAFFPALPKFSEGGLDTNAAAENTWTIGNEFESTAVPYKNISESSESLLTPNACFSALPKFSEGGLNTHDVGDDKIMKTTYDTTETLVILPMNTICTSQLPQSSFAFPQFAVENKAIGLVGEQDVCAQKTPFFVTVQAKPAVTTSPSSISVVHDKKVYPSMMKIQSAKVALNLGMEHISSKGKPRPARHLGSSCTSNCKRCHSPQMTEEERLAVFETFWGFGDHEKQWAFIFNCITLCAPKRKFALVGAKGGKLYHREYSFDIAGKRRKVCKTMFTRTLSISDSWINSALSHCTGEGVVIPDRRGQHVKFSNKHS